MADLCCSSDQLWFMTCIREEECGNLATLHFLEFLQDICKCEGSDSAIVLVYPPVDNETCFSTAKFLSVHGFLCHSQGFSPHPLWSGNVKFLVEEDPVLGGI